MHPLRGDDHVDHEQNNRGDPEGRGDGAVQGQALGRLIDLVALGIVAGFDDFDPGGADLSPGGFGGLDLHLGARQGAGGQHEFP